MKLKLRGNNRIVGRALTIVAMLATCVPVYAAWGISFDELATGTVIDTEYAADVVFSSSPGNEIYAAATTTGTPPNEAASGSSGTPTFIADMYLVFTTAVRYFQVFIIPHEASAGLLGQAKLYENGVHSQTRDIMGTGQIEPIQFELLVVDNLTRLEFVNIAVPFGYDEMSGQPVPEPASAALFGTGLIWFFCRRKRPILSL